MISKSEWQAAHDRVLAERRNRLGDPPAVDEILAYSRGELQGEDEERVRALLVTYPELLHALHTEFEEPEGRVLQFSRYLAPIAAAIALVLGVMLWRAQSQINEPRFVNWEQGTLEPANYRGPADGVKTFSSQADVYVLDILLIADERRFASYRVDLVDTASRRVLWSRASARPANDTFSLLVPRAALRTGRYDAVVYGVNEKGSQQLASYPFRVR